MMLSGKQTKSFLLRFSPSKRCKLSISLGTARRLQSLNSSSTKERKQDREGNSKRTGFGLRVDNVPSHPLKRSTLRFFMRKMEEGGSLIAVPIISSFFRPMRFPMFSGKSSSLEQPDRVRVLIFVKLQMAFGILRSSLQSLRFNVVRLDKCSNDDGSSLMADLFTSSSLRPVRFPKFFGNLLSLEQPDRVSDFRDVKRQMESGRLKRDLQSLRFNRVRPVKCSIDDGSLL